MYQNQRCIQELSPAISAASAFRILSASADCAFLDSSLSNELGRYSILALSPYLKLEKRADGFLINDRLETSISFETYLRDYLSTHIDLNTSDLPILSGAVGYFSYDYGRRLMGIPSDNEAAYHIPDAVLTFYDQFLIEDTKTKKTWLIANGITAPAQTLIQQTLQRLEGQISENTEPTSDSACPLFEDTEPTPDSACTLSEYTEPTFNSPRPLSEDTESTFDSPRPFSENTEPTSDSARPLSVCANFEKEEYKQTVQRMIDYIVEGDIYIANMTQQLTISCEKTPLDLFFTLRTANPSPFGGFLDYGDFQIVCASPERFLQMKNGHVQTRPIKGTRKRGATPEEDRAMRSELEHSEKDKSELLMIVDLERNDLNRVCRPGSVKVTELFTVEEYATVFHLISNIEGDLCEGLTVMDLLEAAFPGGSITGAPKYRAMEIIDELEHGQRGLYTGSIGYLTLDNCCDFNIVIRTALYKDGCYHLGVGGGITAESELEFEYEETLQKAKALLEAMQKKSERTLS